MRSSNLHIIGSLKLNQETKMRDYYPEVKLPDKLKDGPMTLAIWLVVGMTVLLGLALLA